MAKESQSVAFLPKQVKNGGYLPCTLLQNLLIISAVQPFSRSAVQPFSRSAVQWISR